MIKIQLSVDGQAVPVALADTDAAHDFIAMLPMTLTLYDLFGREKFGALPGVPGDMQPATLRAQTCDAGDILCWPAGPDLSIVHRHDGKTVSGAFHVLGRIEAGADALGAPGPLTVTIQAVADEACRPPAIDGCPSVNVRPGSSLQPAPRSSPRSSARSSPAAPR